jgi:hypothetical protein
MCRGWQSGVDICAKHPEFVSGSGFSDLCLKGAKRGSKMRLIEAKKRKVIR